MTFLSGIFIPVTHCAEESLHLLCVFRLWGICEGVAFVLSFILVSDSLLLLLWALGRAHLLVVVVLLFTLVRFVLLLLCRLLFVVSFVFLLPLWRLVVVFGL